MTYKPHAPAHKPLHPVAARPAKNIFVPADICASTRQELHGVMLEIIALEKTVSRSEANGVALG